MARKNEWRIDGMDKLLKDLKRLEKVPQKHVTASVKKGMNEPLKEAKDESPYLTGALSKGIILAGEKSKFKSKKVYRIVFDRNMNDIFQKVVKNPQRNSTSSGTAYYPVSMEYGYFLRNGIHVDGFKFIRKAMESKQGEVQRIIIKTMTERIEKEIRKVGLS